VTGNAWEIARILQQHAGRVLVVNPSETGIAQARAKTDRLDARALARLPAMGEHDAVWMPDERTQVMRRRLARRRRLVQTRASTKNEIHAVLVRRLKGRPPASDLFGVEGRAWLRSLELPLEEQETVDAPDRRPGPAVAGAAALDDRARSQPDRRGHGPGRHRRHPPLPRRPAADRLPRLDPRVRQSGSGPARHGKISKQGSAPVRKALVEGAWSAVRDPGPMRAFYQRVRARRGHQIAIVATARKLAGLFWCLLTREQDYAFGRPSLTAVKLRRLEITAGAPRWQKRTGAWAANHALAVAERRLAEQAEAAYKQLVKDRQAAGPPRQEPQPASRT
jgi:transposase